MQFVHTAVRDDTPERTPAVARRLSRVPLAMLVGVLLASVATTCGPHLPPTTVPPAPAPELEQFHQALTEYVDATQPYRKQAAKASAPEPEDQVRERQRVLAEALRTNVRPNARQGDLFDSHATAYIHRTIAALFRSPRAVLLIDSLEEQREGEPAPAGPPEVGAVVPALRVPPLLREALPDLPAQLEYDVRGRALILRDVDASTVVDFVPEALPDTPVAPEPAASAPSPAGATFFPVPKVRGGVVFALIGDSGSGDRAQDVVAQAMLEYFTSAQHFSFVLMLGDNLYHDDYKGEFLDPYRPLLDRGITFYATLGNHDSELEQHFKPFTMQDRDYYSFDRGNVRFVALDSNHPGDPAQLQWLGSAFDGAGDKWRMVFLHHPLYSSGKHADESARVIRPAFESALVRSGVDVVFSGHDHLYERVAPQHGIRYFVSGGGGRYLSSVRRQSAFDQVAVSVHHFMVVEVAGDVLYFEALRPDGVLIDCGVDWRTDAASEKPPDETTGEWLAACNARRAT